jgi:hypothetical protein
VGKAEFVMNNHTYESVGCTQNTSESGGRGSGQIKCMRKFNFLARMEVEASCSEEISDLDIETSSDVELAKAISDPSIQLLRLFKNGSELTHHMLRPYFSKASMKASGGEKADTVALSFRPSSLWNEAASCLEG